MGFIVVVIGIMLFLWMGIARTERRQTGLSFRGIRQYVKKKHPWTKTHFITIAPGGKKYTYRKKR